MSKALRVLFPQCALVVLVASLASSTANASHSPDGFVGGGFQSGNATGGKSDDQPYSLATLSSSAPVVTRFGVSYLGIATATASSPPLQGSTESGTGASAAVSFLYNVSVNGHGTLLLTGAAGYSATASNSAGASIGGGSAGTTIRQPAYTQKRSSLVADNIQVTGTKGDGESFFITERIDGRETLVIDQVLRASAAASANTLHPSSSAKGAGITSFHFSFIPDVPPPDLTCGEVLSNAVQVWFDRGAIMARFVPNGADLTNAARICGVDHFNWVNKVTDVPASMDFYVVDKNGTRVREVLPPLTDPIESNPADPNAPFSYAYHSDNLNIDRIIGVSPPADNLPYYYNEIAERSLYTHQTHFDFGDKPGLTAGVLGPGEFLGFKTELVGVKSDGTQVPLPNFGTAFSWKTDTVIAGDVSYVKNTGELPEVLSGGVFDVQIVPEPSSAALALTSITLVMLSLVSRRYSRQSS